MSSSRPANRRGGSLWVVATTIFVLVVGYFMFFDSRTGDAPVGLDTATTQEPGPDGSRAPVPVGTGAPDAAPN